MGNLLETLYDVLFAPRKAMRDIAAKKKLFEACIVVIAGMLVPLWGIYSGFGAGVAKGLNIIAVLQVIGSLLLWFITSAVWHLTAELMGGRGTAVGLFAAVGFASVPRIFLIPCWMAAVFMPESVRSFIWASSGLIVALWTLVLDTLAVAGAHELSDAKAALVLLMPVFIIGLILAVIVLAIGSSIFNMPVWF